MISLIELRETYLNLQLAWPDKWPSLPVIFDQCMNSDCLPGLAAALALVGVTHGLQRYWHWLDVV